MANVAAKFTNNPNVIFAPKFKSASEVTEYTKRMATAAYYTSNTADQKRAYSSTYTTFLGANVYAIPNIMRTGVPNTNGFQQRPEKVAPGFNKWLPS
uniref:Uncharacterized protein n=1 Tax=viral metagenome TaxID=1070528 RepID=A0A6C0HLU1_9ZZZZ